MFSKIIAATDGSEASRHAIGVASDLARVHHAKLTLMHVIDDHLLRPRGLTGAAQPTVTPLGFGTATPAWADVRQNAHLQAERLLEAAKSEAVAEGVVEVDTLIEEGDPADCIVDAAKREKADAVVLGSRGVGGVRGLFAGSVSHKVAHEASCTCIAVT